MLNVKGITKVFKKWKTAKARTLHVFPPTMNEQFSMNKFACNFGKVELEFFDSKSKGNYSELQRFLKSGKVQKHVFSMFFVAPTVIEQFLIDKNGLHFFSSSVCFLRTLKVKGNKRFFDD